MKLYGSQFLKAVILACLSVEGGDELAAPLLFLTDAFDATQEHSFEFSNAGNNQAVKNRLRIFNNQTLAQVYDQTIETMKLSHTLPANTLQNGVAYNAELQTIDAQGTASPISSKIVFYCYSEPSWNFANLTENQIIQNSSFTVQIQYQQSQGEPLNSYQIILYDGLSNEIFRTSRRYDTSNLSYNISSLDDGKAYFLQATGETLNGMIVDTGLVPFTVSYTQPAMFALVHLENVYDEGYIKITSNIITIEGTASPDPPTYIDDKKIDVTADGAYVMFDEGFSITNDFTLQCYLENLTQNTTVIELGNSVNKILIQYRYGSFEGQPEQAYFELRAFAGLEVYYIMSNLIAIPSSTERIHLWIRRIGNVYEIRCENMGVVS